MLKTSGAEIKSYRMHNLNELSKYAWILISVNSTFKRQIRFVSSNATRYFWWVICFNREDIVDDVCPDLIVVLMVPSSRLVYDRQADMTGLHLQDINRDLRSINDTVSFGDERLRYNWLGSG